MSRTFEPLPRATPTVFAMLACVLSWTLAGPTTAEEAGSGELEARPEPASDEDAPQAASAATVRPADWMPSKGRQCRRLRKRRFCDGPRMVPVPHGEAAELARSLGLGTRRAASELLLGGPRPEWVAAVEAPPPEALLWPVPEGRLWRSFGRLRHHGRRRFHKGIDIGAPEGTPIVAAAGGLVAYSDNGLRGYGNLVLVVHGDGSVAFYAHCLAAYVFAGQRVTAGQVIGEVGRTGITQGAHLHFELRVDGRPVDPMTRIAAPTEPGDACSSTHPPPGSGP